MHVKFSNGLSENYNYNRNSSKMSKSKNLFIGKIVKNKCERRNNLQILENDILYEGYLHKRFVVINPQKVLRYCRLTRKEFQYFKDKKHSASPYSWPIVTIPLSSIESINLLQIITEKQIIKAKEKKSYIFEISCPKLSIARNKNISLTPTHCKHIQSAFLKRTISRESILNDKENSLTQEIFVNCLKEMHFNNSMGFGREMGNFYKKLGILFRNEEEEKNFHKYIVRNGKEIIEGFMYCNAYNEYLATNTTEMKSHTWISRELDWHLSESRFVFETNCLNKCLIWIYLLNWLKK